LDKTWPKTSLIFCFWMRKILVFGWSMRQRRSFMDGNIDLKCDYCFWLIKDAKKVVYGLKHKSKVWQISRRLWKKRGFGQNLARENETHFLLVILVMLELVLNE
jgi:hypothetical protein